MQCRWPLIVVSLSLLVLVGCGSNPQNRKAISGTVMLDDQPADTGSIEFQPIDAGGVGSGAVINGGSFSMDEEHGLPPGKYRVVVYASKGQNIELPEGFMPGDELPPPPEELIPPDWNTESKQTIEVTDSGPFEFTFNIPMTRKTNSPK